MSVSLAATAIAAGVSLPVGAAPAIFPFRGRRLVVVLINAFFGLPPVVVGLALYLALSHSGPLGFLALLFTPTATVIAQTILAIPIITALVHRASERAWARYGDELTSDGATILQAVPQILMIIRADVVTAVLAGFGRTVSEVGAIILVGGNIRGLTRTMTTTIALQTSQPLHAVGMADWAWRKGCQYGTVICDLERRRIVALLPRSRGWHQGRLAARSPQHRVHCPGSWRELRRRRIQGCTPGRPNRRSLAPLRKRQRELA